MTMSERSIGERREFMDSTRRALKQGTSAERRTASREARADAWTQWLRYRMEVRGGDPAQHLPDLAAELEERIQDELKAAIKKLKDELRKVLA
jgi:hypothetical protein